MSMTCDATDWTVLLGITVHTLQVVAVEVVAEEIAKKSSMNQVAPVSVSGCLNCLALHQVQLNGRTQFSLIAAIKG